MSLRGVRPTSSRIAILALAVALIVRIPSLDLPLIEWHGWRQTWTAYTALLFHEQGIDLLHPKLPIFGRPFEVPQEFPLVQAIAAIVMDLGVSADLAMRATHLGLFFLSAALLYGLMRRVAGAWPALATLVVFLFVPTNLLWSRASLVEYGATAGAIGFLWAGIVWRERRTWPFFVAALIAGTLGMLVKPTTPIFWPLALILWRASAEQRGLVPWLRARLDPPLVALCTVPTAVALAWTAHADAIKAASEASAFMTSAATRPFYYASLADRVDPVIWKRTWSWISQDVVGVGLLPILAVGLWAAARSRRPAFWVGIGLAAALPVAIFYGGYYKHDYYWAALTPGVALFVGLGVAWLFGRAPTPMRRGVLVVALAAAGFLSLQQARPTWSRMYPPLNDAERVLPRARELASQSRPDDLVIVVGRAYDPDLAYYARRRTLMLSVENHTDRVVAQAVRDGYGVLFSWNPAVDRIDVARSWRWTGVLAAHTYALAATPGELRGASYLATDDLAAFDARARTAPPLIDALLRLPCDRSTHAVPAGAQGTWLRIRPDPAARMWATPLLAPVPLRSVVVLGPSVTLGQDRALLSCDGAREIVIEAAVAAPPP